MEKKKTKKWIVLVVCILVLILIISIVPATVVVKGILLGKREWKVKGKDQHIVNIVESNQEEQNAIKEIEYQNITYTSTNAKIADDKIGDKLGIVTLTENETLDANVFKVDNCSEKCVVAVQFSNTLDYYVYENFAYNPETLGDLINDLNLKEELSFKKIYYNYDYIDLKLKKHTEYVEFYDINNEDIWQMLFDDINLKNVANNSNVYNQEYLSQHMSISVSIPILGLGDWLAFSLSDNGYLTTVIFDTVDAFYIGKNKAKQFINYIIENYDGYESNGWY